MTIASMIEKYNDHKRKFRSLQDESVIINRHIAQLNARSISLKKELQKIENSLNKMCNDLSEVKHNERRKTNEVNP